MSPTAPRTSYSSASRGLRERVLEIAHLVRGVREHPTSNADWVLRIWRGTQERVREHTGVVLRGKKGLDIGPGQQLGCLRCFSVANDMVAIDTDYIVQADTPAEYARVLRTNGVMRTIKTLGRRALGVDAGVKRQLAQAMGVRDFPRLPVLRVSATAMTFEDNTFDFAYSHSVFEHIPDPEAALKEVVRVLKPGGVAYISAHQYTSHSGQHDPKILSGPCPQPPLWPHLRPSLQHTVHPNAWVNKLSLKAWKELFPRAMPGVKVLLDRQDDEIGDGLATLRAQGELSEYTDEELMTVNVIAIWQKPVG